MILFYIAFVYLKIITAERLQSSRTLDRRVGRQFTSWYVCLGARPPKTRLKQVELICLTSLYNSWSERAMLRVCLRVSGGWSGRSSGLIQKRVGPIIKGNSFVLAWHLKDRHLVSRQRHLCSLLVPHSTHERSQEPSRRTCKPANMARSSPIRAAMDIQLPSTYLFLPLPTCSKTIQRLTNCWITRKAESISAEVREITLL